MRTRTSPWKVVLNGLAAVLVLSSLWAIAIFSPVPYRQVTHGSRDVNAVALTFDDGPGIATWEVLDILDEFGVKATFFVVGENVRRMSELTAMIADRGHEVGAHSNTHSRWLPFQLPSRSGRDAELGIDAVIAVTRVRPQFFRPPHGKSSPWMRWSTTRMGLEIIGWDVHGSDWKRVTSQRITREIVEGARPGSIILLHDGLDLHETPDRNAMVEALPLIISGLKERGFTLMTVGELLGR